MPATSGSGKTTLTAALVQAGWSYGTDEAVGVREGSLEVATYPKPLVLDTSQAGPAGARCVCVVQHGAQRPAT